MGFFKYTSDWDYVTSEDTTASLVFSVSTGTVVLKNRVTKQECRLGYSTLSAGLSKGLPVGFSEATFDNWSGGSEVYCDRYFSPDLEMPCYGFMIGAGAAIGFTDNEANGANATVAILGASPMFAGFKMYGSNRASLPGFGFSAGVTKWFLKSFTDPPKA